MLVAFSVACGCNDDDDDGGAVSPTPTTSASGDCPAGESIGVTSTAYPEMDSCLEEVEIVAGGELEYASTSAIIVALAFDEDVSTEVCAFRECREL